MSQPNPQFMDMSFEIEALKDEVAILRATVAGEQRMRNGAYTERNCLVALFARIFPSGLRKTDIPGWDQGWDNCVYIDTPVGQMSWHYHDSDAHLFEGLPAYDKPWDGHSTEQKYARLRQLTRFEFLMTHEVVHTLGDA
jgi:hypothetical protein